MPYKHKVFVTGYTPKKQLAKQVAKNTKILNTREFGRARSDLTTNPSATTSFQNMSAVAQGDGINARHGNKIHAESISIRGSILKNTASPFTKIRFMLVRDNLGTTTAPTIGDIFDDEGDFHDNKHRTPDQQQMKRFTVFWDKYFVLNETFDGQTSATHFKYYKKLSFNIFYDGTAITDEGKNSLWLMQASDEATNTPLVSADFVFRYSDL